MPRSSAPTKKKPTSKRNKKSASVGIARGTKPSAKGKQGKQRAIDIHPDKKTIIARILKGESLAALDREYGFGKGVSWKYVKEVLAERVQEAVQQGKDDIRHRLESIFDRLQKLLDACHTWLQDPDDPEKYTLCPRMDEIEVVYLDVNENGNIVNKKALLSSLLARALNLDDMVEVKTRNMDNRKLLVDTANAMSRQMEIIGKIIGQVPEGGTVNNFNFMTQWVEFKTIIMEATAKTPEVRKSIIEAMEARLEEEPSR
jgi:hypothetical protein